MPRKILGGVVVAVWVGLMVMLIQRQGGSCVERTPPWDEGEPVRHSADASGGAGTLGGGGDSAAGASTTDPAEPIDLRPAAYNPAVEEEWMAVSYQGSPAGYGHAVRERLAGGTGWKITDDSVMYITVLGERQKMEVHVTATTGPEFALEDFTFDLTADNHVSMHVQGTVRNNVLLLEIHSGANGGGQRQTMDIPLGGPVYLDMTVVPRAARRGFDVGRSFTVPIFDPASMSTQTTTVRVVAEEELNWRGETVHTWVLEQEFQGMKIRTWVGNDGHMYKSETPLGFVLTRAPQDEALASIPEGAEGPDLMMATSIPLDAELPNPGALSYLSVILDGADLSGFSLGAVPRQSFDGVTLTVKRARAPGTYVLPVTDERFTEHLQATALVESTAPEIKELARRLAGDSTDARAVARRLYQWVHDNIDKTPTLSIPTATDVLRTRRGDCNEHTVLLTALARAAGIPAKMNTGLVYLDGRFYYHAWVSLYLAEWIPVDAALGQFPADVTHLTFLEGGLEQQSAILRLVGNLRIRYQDAG